MGVAHGLMKDDIYDNMFIPKGAIVMGNSWYVVPYFLRCACWSNEKRFIRAMLHDEKTYGPNVDDFNPDRFFLPGVKADISPTFGYGRRYEPLMTTVSPSLTVASSMCPGRHLAENAIFIGVASLLKVFNFSPAKGADGKELPFNITRTSGAVS
jgi:hypothetical protein